jgi:hypothetical protein
VNTLPAKFQVWQTAMDCLDYCWRHRRLMERYGLIPMLLSVGAAWALLFFGVNQTEPSAAMFAALAVQILILLPPSVAWYRTVVYGEMAALRPMFTFTRLELRLLVWQLVAMVVLAVGFGLAVLVVAGIGAALRATAGDIAALIVVVPLGIAGVVFFIVIATRASMVYALATLDTPVSFRIAWDLTRHIAWRLTGAFGIISLAVVLFGAFAELIAWIVGALIAWARGSDISAVVPYVRAVAQAPTSLLWLFGTATLFGLIYKARAETGPAPMDAPAPV